MEIVRSLSLPATPEEVFPHVEDLDRYPTWMDLVHEVERVDGDDAWDVELRAEVGPFARSKRLRMRRTRRVVDREVVFERDEVDGREHSPWTLHVLLAPDAPDASADGVDESTATELTMRLSYGGGLWTGAVLQRVLDDKVESGSRALLELVAGGA